MSWEHLGETFDIHGGGIDLVFPHHENEIAQSRCAFGHDVMANVWMHNGFLQVEGEKMSKSFGNFITIHDLLHTDKFGGRPWAGYVLRHSMLMTHYREPIDWTLARVKEASSELNDFAAVIIGRLGDALKDVQIEVAPSSEVVEALSDDLNYSKVRSYLQSLSGRASASDKLAAEKLFTDCVFLGMLPGKGLGALTLGDGFRGNLPISVREKIHHSTVVIKAALANNAPTIVDSQRSGFKALGADFLIDHWHDVTFVPIGGETPSESFIQAKVNLRLAARKAKNWAESDRIRDELAALGVVLKDNKDGTPSW